MPVQDIPFYALYAPLDVKVDGQKYYFEKTEKISNYYETEDINLDKGHAYEDAEVTSLSWQRYFDQITTNSQAPNASVQNNQIDQIKEFVWLKNLQSGFLQEACVSRIDPVSGQCDVELHDGTRLNVSPSILSPRRPVVFSFESDTIQEFLAKARENGEAWACARRFSSTESDNTEEDAFRFYRLFRRAQSQTDPNVRRRELLQVLEEFEKRALELARTVVDELHLPLDSPARTVRHARRFGGTAGGDKFCKFSIMIKFAVDPVVQRDKTTGKAVFLYGRDHPDIDRAAKACANELKTSTRLFRYFYDQHSRHRLDDVLSNLEVVIPIQFSIEYKGWRMVAMPVLPLADRAKLVYGSDNGGRSVFNSIREVNDLLLRLARTFGLAEHWVGQSNIALALAGDVEVHVDSEGVLFLLDVARFFPPEAPVQCEHLYHTSGEVFCRLLRPEFLRNSKHMLVSLSSDALSNWSFERAHHDNARQATSLLIQTVIPALARDLDARAHADSFPLAEALMIIGKNVRKGFLDKQFDAVKAKWSHPARLESMRSGEDFWNDAVAHFLVDDDDDDLSSRPYFVQAKYNQWLVSADISTILHGAGVSLRHLGLLRSKVSHPRVKALLLREMVRRACKQLVRSQLRCEAAMAPSSLPGILPSSSTALVNLLEATLQCYADPRVSISSFGLYSLEMQRESVELCLEQVMSAEVRARFGPLAFESEEELNCVLRCAVGRIPPKTQLLDLCHLPELQPELQPTLEDSNEKRLSPSATFDFQLNFSEPRRNSASLSADALLSELTDIAGGRALSVLQPDRRQADNVSPDAMQSSRLSDPDIELSMSHVRFIMQHVRMETGTSLDGQSVARCETLPFLESLRVRALLDDVMSPSLSQGAALDCPELVVQKAHEKCVALLASDSSDEDTRALLELCTWLLDCIAEREPALASLFDLLCLEAEGGVVGVVNWARFHMAKSLLGPMRLFRLAAERGNYEIANHYLAQCPASERFPEESTQVI